MVRRVTVRVDIRAVPQQLQFEDSRQDSRQDNGPFLLRGEARFVTVERPDRPDPWDPNCELISIVRRYPDRRGHLGFRETGCPSIRLSVRLSVWFCLVNVVIT
jgi:hypothetical protein